MLKASQKFYVMELVTRTSCANKVFYSDRFALTVALCSSCFQMPVAKVQCGTAHSGTVEYG